MKVILLKDVAKIGRRFDVVEVPNGHAQNMLIPKGLAEIATPAGIKRIAKQKERNQSQGEELLAKMSEVSTKTEVEPLVINLEANELGHLFKAVSVKDVCEVAKDRGLDVPEELIVMTTPIKEVGDHTVDVVVKDNTLRLSIKVIAK